MFRAPEKSALMHYRFPMEMDRTRQSIVDWLSADGVYGLSGVESEHISVHGSGTQALFQALLSFREEGLHSVLVVTPIYFSVVDSAEVLGFSRSFFPSRLQHDCMPDVKALSEAIESTRPSVVVVTDPVYPTGARWKLADLQQVLSVCRAFGAQLLIDASLSGLDWTPSPASSVRDLTREGFDKLTIVQSPAKALFLNGAKFAHVVTEPARATNLRENDEICNGALSFAQAALADAVYERLATEASLPEVAVEEASLANVRQRNIGRCHALFEEVVRSSAAYGWRATRPASGVLTMVSSEIIPMTLENEMGFTQEMLAEHGVHAMPGSIVRLAEEINPLSYRLNLSLRAADVMAGVRAIGEVARSAHWVSP